MSVNSSSINDSALRPHLSSVSPHIFFGLGCFITPPSSFIFTSFFITNILLLLPLCIFILYLGLQQWRRQSSASTATMMSHSDIFTYHLVAMEIIGVFAYIICCCNLSGDHFDMLLVGFCLWSLIWYGEMFFHVLTCVERYLAVIHPITYLSLRGERGIRVRNISIGCVWLLSIGGVGLMILEYSFVIMDFCLFVSSLVVISFCSLSVLCALIRPGPGEQSGDRKRVDQSKRRAFYTIMSILGVLLLRCVWNLMCAVWILFVQNTECVMLASGAWLSLPSSLVLPLLFLHRAGTLACCKNCNK